LNGFSQSHVVGEAAAESEFPDKSEPTESFPLVIPELAREPGRRIHRADTTKSFQFTAHAQEGFIESDFGLACQQRIEQSGLAPRKSDLIAFFLSESADKTITAQPFFRKRTQRAIAERNHFVAAFERFQQLRQRYGVAFEFHGATNFEPVDA